MDDDINLSEVLSPYIYRYSENEPLTSRALISTEEEFKIKLPKEFVAFSSKFHGAVLKNAHLDLPNFGGRFPVNSFLKITEKNEQDQTNRVTKPEALLDTYYTEPGYILFGSSMGLNYICFDYRGWSPNYESDIPVCILYTNELSGEPECPKFKVVPIAASFKEFVLNIYEFDVLKNIST